MISISEHCLFEEQLGILKTATDSANDNPPILSGERAHGGVALTWNNANNNLVTPIDTIDIILQGI